jgi:hypothetical protein
MKKTRHLSRTLAGCAALILGGAAAAAAPSPEQQKAAETLASQVAAELKAQCPIADAGDQAAFDRCRGYLFNGSRLKQALSPFILWGRQHKNPAQPLKETHLTQFAPDVWAGIYAPIFMFDGTSQVQWVESEKMFRVKLGAAFRNRLAPGQFPYPFWHEAAKWGAYENANGMLLWLAPDAKNVKVAQFTWADGPLAGVKVTPVKHAFEGKWVWTDAQGKTQPAVTLFDGLFSERNPHKAQVDKDYRALAISLRESQCMNCHVPDNPDKMKRLVLLQTPAHAAGEIGRILAAVRKDRMPLDETGIEQPLDAKTKQTLLELGSAFEKSVQAAKRWEAGVSSAGGEAPAAR